MGRLELHELLKDIVPNVYFQPPSNVKMVYPCIRYERADRDTKFADNSPYAQHVRYSLTVIDPDPDSDLVRKVAALPRCSQDRFYAEDSLNHDVFTIYYKENLS